MTNRAKFRAAHYLLAALIVLLDQATKAMVAARVPLNVGWIDVIPGFFAITHVQNRGAAFSMFADGSTPATVALLIGFSSIAMLVIGYFLWKVGNAVTLTSVSLTLVLGGAVGNLWDRIQHGRVTDFLHFYVGKYSWPDFNVADSAIVVGAMLLILEIVFTGSEHHEKEQREHA